MSLTGVYSHLTNTAGITALVGKRSRRMVLPQNAIFPAIVFQQIGSTPVITMGGVGGSGLSAMTIQITCWAKTLLAAKQLGDAVRVATDGFSGTMGSDTVKAVLMDGEHDEMDKDPSSGRELFAVIQIYTIWTTESTS